ASEVARALWTGQFSLGMARGRFPGETPSDDPAALTPPSQGEGPSCGPRPDAEDRRHLPAPPGADPATSIDLLRQVDPTSGDAERHYWQGVARIGIQVADALEYSHQQGVLHRDVKPSNLLLDLQGTVWVTD